MFVGGAYQKPDVILEHILTQFLLTKKYSPKFMRQEMLVTLLDV